MYKYDIVNNPIALFFSGIYNFSIEKRRYCTPQTIPSPWPGLQLKKENPYAKSAAYFDL